MTNALYNKMIKLIMLLLLAFFGCSQDCLVFNSRMNKNKTQSFYTSKETGYPRMELCLNNEGIFIMRWISHRGLYYTYSFGEYKSNGDTIVLEHSTIDSITYSIISLNQPGLIRLFPENLVLGDCVTADITFSDKSKIKVVSDNEISNEILKVLNSKSICSHDKCVDNIIIGLCLLDFRTEKIDFDDDSCKGVFFNLPPHYGRYQKLGIHRVDTLISKNNGLYVLKNEDIKRFFHDTENDGVAFLKRKNKFKISKKEIEWIQTLNMENQENRFYRHLFERFFFI